MTWAASQNVKSKHKKPDMRSILTFYQSAAKVISSYSWLCQHHEIAVCTTDLSCQVTVRICTTHVATKLTCVTTDLIIALASIKMFAKLSLWLLLLLWNSTEWCLSRQQLNWILLHATYQTFKYSKLQQLSAQQHTAIKPVDTEVIRLVSSY